jgi:hypothetical protein
LALRLRLEEVIADPRLHAELRLGDPPKGVLFGQFPPAGSLIQQIDIEDLTRLEAGAPGNGVAILFHEIVGNYHAHAGSDYEESHEPALEAERRVFSELVPAKGRPGGGRAILDEGKGVIRWVLDYEQYFLVFDRYLNRDVMVDPRWSARVNVGTFTIDGFAPVSDAVPGAAQPVIAAVADAMRMHPAATVRIEVGGRDAQLALRRAGRVQDAILGYGKGRRFSGFDLRSGLNFRLVATGQSVERLVIVVD